MSTIVSDLVSHLQCGEVISANDAVYINSADGKIYKYDPLQPLQVYAGIAKEAGLLNAFIRVVQSGRVKGFSGLTPGKFVYASVTVPGGFQLTEPGSTLKVVLGIAKSATELTVNGALGIKTGGDGTGSGSLDTILQLTATEQLTDWSTGNNATVLAGGVLAGSFVKEASTPLHGAESYKYTQAAGSLNDYFLSKSFPVDVRFRGQQVYFSAPIQYNGNTGDIQIVVYCATTSTVLTTTSNTIIGTNGSTQTVIASCVIPLTCTGIRVGFHVKVLNSGKIFSFDDIQVGMNLYQAAQLNNVTNPIAYTPTLTGGASFTDEGIFWHREGKFLVARGTGTITTPNASAFTVSLPTGLTVDSSTQSTTTDSNSVGVLYKISGTVASTYATVSQGPWVAFTDTAASSSIAYFSRSNTGSRFTKSPGNDLFATGDRFRFEFKIPIQGWTAGNTAIVTPTQQISSDTLPFTFKSTAIVDADPVGTFNTYTFAANSNTPVISASAPTQTTSSMNTNGVQLFSRAYNATSTTASPARIDIKIGKGPKGKEIAAFAGLAKTNSLSFDMRNEGSLGELFGTQCVYDEVTGILRLECATSAGSVTVRRVGLDVNFTSYTSGYFVFNASTSPSITALPILQPRIATVKRLQASNVSGYPATAGAWTALVLDTINDPSGIVTSLAANQITLPAGTYHVRGLQILFSVNDAQIRLRDVSGGVTYASSGNAYSPLSSSITTAILSEVFTINNTTTLTLQYQVQTTNATNGLNAMSSNFGEAKDGTKLEIQKIR